MSKKITLETKLAICKEYEKGKLSQKQIGEKFKIHSITISKILKEFNIKPLPYYRLNTGRLKLNINFFEKIDEPKKAYWLGFLMADGNINKSGGKCSLISKDLEIIEKFKKDIDSEHKINVNINFDKRTNKTYTSYSIQVTNANFVNHLKNCGVTKEKSDFIKLPEIRRDLLPYFFAGMFDGDGYLGTDKNRKHLLQTSIISTKEVILFLQNYLITNFNVSKTKLIKVTKNKNNVWKFRLHKDSLLFLNWIYGDKNFDYLSRKYKKYEEYKYNYNTNHIP